MLLSLKLAGVAPLMTDPSSANFTTDTDTTPKVMVNLICLVVYTTEEALSVDKINFFVIPHLTLPYLLNHLGDI